MMMKLKNRILGILLLFILLPLSIFGGFSIYETNRKIDDMTECNLATVSENQRINIKNFCEDRKSEMEMIANYAMTQAAIKESVGEPSPYDAGKVDLEYINNVLKERKKYGVFVASISILDKDFRVVASSESYEAGDTKQKKSLSHFVTDSSERNSFQKAWDEVDHNSNPVGKIYYKYRGDSYVTYYSDVDNTNWGMRLTENLSAQRQTGRSYTVMLCLAFVFFVLAIFIVQIFITKNVLAPIEQIMNVFKDIKATQDYSKRLPKSNSVEMNQLSDEINGLLTHIEDENIQEKERQRHLRELAECAPLTGINNKKAIEQKMLAMVQSATDKKVRISVGFLDIDDCYYPDTVRILESNIEDADADIAAGAYVARYENGKFIHNTHSGAVNVWNNYEAMKEFLIRESMDIYVWTKLYRKTFLDKYHIRFEVGRCDEDFLFNSQAFLYSSLTVKQDSPIYLYTIRDASTSRTFRDQQFLKYLEGTFYRVNEIEQMVVKHYSSLAYLAKRQKIMYLFMILSVIVKHDRKK